MGCNCNKRKKRVLRREDALAERAARLATANPSSALPPAAATPAARTSTPTWSPERGPRSTSSTDDVAS